MDIDKKLQELYVGMSDTQANVIDIWNHVQWMIVQLEGLIDTFHQSNAWVLIMESFLENVEQYAQQLTTFTSCIYGILTKHKWVFEPVMPRLMKFFFNKREFLILFIKDKITCCRYAWSILLNKLHFPT